MTLHPVALRAADAYLAMADAAAPGLVEALYVVGSAALQDFRPGLSDLDFVAVTSGRIGPAALAALADGHADLARTRPAPPLDGIYVTWDELRAGPLEVPEGPCVREGRFLASGCHERHPATWGRLGSDAVTVRGPLCAGTVIWRDPARLERWVLGTIDGYWQPWLARGARAVSRRGVVALRPRTVEAGVLGICRLHYALVTGLVPSKSDAGLYGLITFPRQWHRIIDEALRIRREPGSASFYRNPYARRREMLAFVRTAADDARALAAATRVRRPA
ncbi:aminoglycoside adenylyltransferase domain-containing protein [Methylobacterium durans]|uniref:Aminoglycoside (3'') (9) adenylyltransferase n=1 Tax=Methylobacterium durans TaxID=2202825 RepID=A0A2U8WAB1_9HYPH|nr:aminoglycoside adenylyltransferase domain-containing protein [Methylobacterium durans]AWN42548.1 DNA polymerase subunit beta [Methylobacterium durans]